MAERETGHKYAFFPGCLVTTRLPYIEAAVRKSMRRLGAELVDMPETTCCPEPTLTKALNQKTWLAIAARNLSIAEEIGLDILTPCNGCYGTFKTVNYIIKTNEKERVKINDTLKKVNREYKGKIQVKHVVEALYKDIGKERIKKEIQKPLKNIKIAVHYGCHLLRPSEIIQLDDPEQPTFLDELVEVLGAKSVDYERKMMCCGGEDLKIHPQTAYSILKEKLSSIKEADPDCIVVTCPLCMIQLDENQALLQRRHRQNFNIPVFYYSELLCLALNINLGDQHFKLHRIKADEVVKKIVKS